MSVASMQCWWLHGRHADRMHRCLQTERTSEWSPTAQSSADAYIERNRTGGLLFVLPHYRRFPRRVGVGGWIGFPRDRFRPFKTLRFPKPERRPWLSKPLSSSSGLKAGHLYPARECSSEIRAISGRCSLVRRLAMRHLSFQEKSNEMEEKS